MSVADELRKLADLKKEGLLTEEEFEAQKAILLEVDVDTDAPAKRIGGLPVIVRLLLGAAVGFGILLLLGHCQPSAEATEKGKAREAIKFCWSETERKALTPEAQRFTARTCEFMEDEFRKKYGHEP